MSSSNKLPVNEYSINLNIETLEDEINDLLSDLEPNCPKCPINLSNKEYEENLTDCYLVFFNGEFVCNYCDFIAISNPKIKIIIEGELKKEKNMNKSLSVIIFSNDIIKCNELFKGTDLAMEEVITILTSEFSEIIRTSGADFSFSNPKNFIIIYEKMMKDYASSEDYEILDNFSNNIRSQSSRLLDISVRKDDIIVLEHQFKRLSIEQIISDMITDITNIKLVKEIVQ